MNIKEAYRRLEEEKNKPVFWSEEDERNRSHQGGRFPLLHRFQWGQYDGPVAEVCKKLIVLYGCVLALLCWILWGLATYQPS